MAVCPEHVPPTEIRASTRDNVELIDSRFAYPMIAKRIKSSMGDGVTLIENRTQLDHHAEAEPVLYIQERLPIDRDLRIVLVGDEVLTAYWRVTPLGGYRSNVSQGGQVDYDAIPDAAIALVCRLAKALDINHAGFDIAMAWGHPFVFEFNRLFGNQGIPDSSRRLGQAILRTLQRDDDMGPGNRPPFGLTG